MKTSTLFENEHTFSKLVKLMDKTIFFEKKMVSPKISTVQFIEIIGIYENKVKFMKMSKTFHNSKLHTFFIVSDYLHRAITKPMLKKFFNKKLFTCRLFANFSQQGLKPRVQI